jgi:hypothetical protein
MMEWKKGLERPRREPRAGEVLNEKKNLECENGRSDAKAEFWSRLWGTP